MTAITRSVLIFGARNLGRAIIETLVAQGWDVAGAARSDETLANITAAGALALRSDITDQAAVRATVEEAARALGPLHLVVNAAAAYGGTGTGAVGGGPIADAAPDAFDSWSVAPARSAFAFLS
ncbi:MAG: family oxidoreductase, partial [Conexibacter sp.]|nr:family oxidoreductase [Conexibacter sp.]